MKNKQLAKSTALFIITEVVLQSSMYAQGTAAKIGSVYAWIKPVLSAILMILTLVFAGRLLYKFAFKHDAAAADVGMFLVFLVFWGIWAYAAQEILALFGVVVTF